MSDLYTSIGHPKGDRRIESPPDWGALLGSLTFLVSGGFVKIIGTVDTKNAIHVVIFLKFSFFISGQRRFR